MKNKKEIQDELNEMAPFLAKRKGMEEGFQVPRDYFQSLPDQVLKQIHAEAPVEAEHHHNWLDGVVVFFQQIFQPRYALAYASVAVLVAAGVYFWGGTNEVAPSFAALETISEEAIESYLTENIDAIGTDLLEAYFADGSNEKLPGLELNEMENYLDKTLDDIEVDDFEDLF